MAALINNVKGKVLKQKGSGDSRELVVQAPCPAVLLVKDKEGEEATFYVGVVPRTVIHKVLRGSLLTLIPEEKLIPRADGKAVHNYQTIYNERTITLFCDGEDVAPLSDYEQLLLADVQRPEDRYQIFITLKLDWGSQLKVGDQVLVSIPAPLAAESGATQKASAMIQYVGSVDSLPGLTFGVEILDPQYYGQGTTDGTFRHERYFICHDNNGLFVSFDKLSEHSAGGSLTESPPRGQRYTPHDDQQDGQRKPKQPAMAQPINGPPSRLKVGNRVVIFNKNAAAIHGTVRWTGKYGYRDEKKQYHNCTAVGIETDVRVFSTELESYLPPRSHAFIVGRNKGQVFVCEEEAMLEKDYSAQVTPAEKPPVQSQQPKPHRETEVNPPHGVPKLDVTDPTALAQQMGIGHVQLMQEQTKALQQAAEKKAAKELIKLKQAVGPEESLHVKEQERLLRQCSEDRRREKEMKEMEEKRNREKEVEERRRREAEMEERRRREAEMEERRKREAQKLSYIYDTVAPPLHHQGSSAAAQPHHPPASQPSAPSTATPLLPPRSHDHPPAQPGPQPGSPHIPQHMAYAGQPGAPLPAGLEVESAVQLVQDPSRTGVIRWTGYLPEIQGLITGVELDEPMEGCGDGEWREQRYFSCPPERGFFCPSVYLKHDDHAMSHVRADTHVELGLRREVKQLRDQLAAQSLEQQNLCQQVEQLLEEKQQQRQQQEQLQREKQRLENESQQLESENQRLIHQLEQEKQLRVQEISYFQQQLQQEQERSRQLQERLDTSAAELEQVRPTTQLLSSVPFNTVSRTEVKVQANIGEGAWGEVAKGKCKGQPVAVK